MLGLWGLGGMHGDIIARSHQAHSAQRPHSAHSGLLLYSPYDTLLTLYNAALVPGITRSQLGGHRVRVAALGVVLAALAG